MHPGLRAVGRATVKRCGPEWSNDVATLERLSVALPAWQPGAVPIR